MKDRTITLKIGANITDLQGKLRKAQNDMKDWTNQAQKDLQQHRAQWSSLSNTVGGFGLAMVGMSALAVKGFAEFDKSMSKVKASGADAANNLNALRAAAIKAGADTQYSAADAADAITDLAKAGVSAKDILGGGLSGALSLAASGQMQVKEAAEVTATALSQFNLPGTKASHVADLLAAGAGKARGEVSDLGMALSQGGLVASQTGLSLEETTAALSAFAAKGMLGSDAGTSLKTMLQRLTPQSDKAQEQFDALGISAYDASGKFVGLSNFAGQLHGKMANLTPEARNAAMSIMFGSDAVRAANVLFTEGSDGIQKWTDAVDDSGFAMRQASTLTDNLAGDWERLSGSIDTVFIQSGKGANDTLRGMAQSANAVVDAIGQIPEPALNAMVLLTGAGGLGLSGAAGMMKLVGALSDTKDALANLGKGATIAKIGIAGVGTALGVATIAVSMWASEAAAARQRTDELSATLEVAEGKAKATGETFAKLNEQMANTRTSDWGPSVLDMLNKVGISAADAQQYILGNADAIAKVTEQANRYTLRNGAMSGGVGLIAQLNNLKASYEGSIKSTEQKAQADKEAGVSASGNATAVKGQVSALKSFNEELFATANALLKLSGNELGWRAALDDTTEAIKKNGKAERLKNGELDLSTKKGRENQAALNGLAQSSLTYVDSLVKQGASEKEIQGVLTKSRDSFIKQAVAAGMSSSAATQLANDLGLIPENTNAYIRSTLDETGMQKWSEYDPKDKKAYIDTYVREHNRSRTGGAKLASGGAVFGSGTATSDSIPARLSNGEHVLTASDVQKAGGQDAIYRLRAGIQSGALKFAGGGEVPGFAKGGAAKANARERASLLADLRKQLRRGEIDVSSGSGMSIIDQMLEWADNTALSKSRRSSLSKTALAAEKTLTDLTTRLTAATNQVDSLQSVYDDVQKSLGGTDLASMLLGPQRTDLNGNVWYEAPSASSITAGMAGKAAKVRAFANKLSQLQKAGMAPAVLQDIASLGVTDGTTAADAYLADVGQIAGINAAYAELASASGAGAQYVTEASYKGGLSAAKGIVDGLNADLTSLGQSLAGAFAGALGYKLSGTTLKKRAMGGPVTAGEFYQVNEMGMEIFRPAVSGVILTASQSQQAIGTGLSANDLARAFSGLAMTLLVDGKPVRAIVQTELGAEAARIQYAIPGGF